MSNYPGWASATTLCASDRHPEEMDVTATVIGKATVTALRQALRGAVLTPADHAYDEARSVWNGAVDRRPALIAGCLDAADVARAVRFARDNQLLTAVRGGGHGVAGTAVCDGGIVIDLSPMRRIRVDPAAGTYRLHPVGPTVLAGPVFFALEDAPELVRFYRGWIASAPDELTTIPELPARTGRGLPPR
jgi:FAD binding domain